MSVARNFAPVRETARRSHIDIVPPRRATKTAPKIDVTALERRVAAERRLVALPQSWVADELAARTALGMIGAVTVASIVTLLYLALL